MCICVWLTWSEICFKKWFYAECCNLKLFLQTSATRYIIKLQPINMRRHQQHPFSCCLLFFIFTVSQQQHFNLFICKLVGMFSASSNEELLDMWFSIPSILKIKDNLRYSIDLFLRFLLIDYFMFTSNTVFHQQC